MSLKKTVFPMEIIKNNFKIGNLLIGTEKGYNL